MNINLVSKTALLTVVALAVVFIMGCKTTPPIDWNSRIGNYTYDQAILDFGPPDRQAKLSDGRTVAEWITHYRNNGGLIVGTGFYSGPGSVGIIQNTGSSFDKVMKLVFNPDNQLLSWSKFNKN